MKIHVIRIMPSGDIEPIQMELTLEAIQKEVGGSFQHLDILVDLKSESRKSIGCMLLNEEGKLLDLPQNDTATRIAASHCGIAFPHDYIAGTAIVTGEIVGDDYTSLSDETKEILKLE